jgi:hypothetical protein
MDWLIITLISFLLATGDPCADLPRADNWRDVLTSGERIARLHPGYETFPMHIIYRHEGDYYAFIGQPDSQHGRCMVEIPPFTITVEIGGMIYEAEWP